MSSSILRAMNRGVRVHSMCTMTGTRCLRAKVSIPFIGLEPNDWKPMPSVGLGVQEIRIHTDVEHRVLYVAKFAEAVEAALSLADRPTAACQGVEGAL